MFRWFLALLVVAGSAHAAPCSTGQQPFSIGGYSASSALAACQGYAASLGYFGPQIGPQVNATRWHCEASDEEGRPPYAIGFVDQVCESTPPEEPPAEQPTGEAVSVICNGTCTVTHVISVPEVSATAALSVAKVGDYMSLWGLILAAAVVVLCAKAIYNMFRVDTGDAR